MDSQENQEEGTSAENDESLLMHTRSDRSIKKQNFTSTTQPAFILPPSPPSFVTMGQLAEAANAFYNMSLAHEITVDSDFKIEKYEPPEESLENRVKKTMHRAFWDLLRSSLESNPPDYEPTLRLLEEVKQSLSGLVLSHQKTLKKLVDESLDLDIVRAELEETGSLSLEVYAARVISLMKQFCAPVRDSEVEELRHISDPVDAFQHAFTLLEKMHMDLANFTIAQMRPYIREQAVAYERTKFATFLETQQALGIDGLFRTREWIRTAYEQLASIEASAVTEAHPNSVIQTSMVPIRSLSYANVNTKKETSSSTETNELAEPKTVVKSVSSPIPPTPNNILREAYLALLTWPVTKDWPETMIMDQQRLKDLGSQLTRIVTLSSLVLVVCNYVIANIDQIFNSSFRVRTDSTMMLELKRTVCRAALTAMDNVDCTKPPDPEMNTADQIVLTVEHWVNRILTPRSAPTQDASASAFVGAGHEPYIFPATISETLKTQIHEVFKATHPVYILMHKRAMEFLRSALSSHPPETLPLPAGFSVLLDVTDESGMSNLSTNTPTGPSVMATGGHMRSARLPDEVATATTSNQRTLSSLNNLSLSNVASRLLPLLAHNRHVFGPRYAEIIQGILMPSKDVQSKETPDEGNTFEMNP